MNQVSAFIQNSKLHYLHQHNTDIIPSHDKVRGNGNCVVCMVTGLQAERPRVRIPLGMRYFSILQIVKLESGALPIPLFNRYGGKTTEA
jgi:hypothetical protein